MPVVVSDHPEKAGKIEKLMVYEGLKKLETEKAETGEIVCIGGLNEVIIGQTICHPDDTTPLAGVVVGEPTLHILMGPNTSPFSGREGQFSTGRQLEERLTRELASNLSLKVVKNGGKFTVSGRGELHLAILLETMRREGYEMEVGKPEVIMKKTEAGMTEPVEEVVVVVPNEYIGIISEEFGKRWARLLKMSPITETETEFIYVLATRAALGLRSLLMTATRGTLVYSSVILGYEAVGKPLSQNRRGVLIASEGGTALAYGLENAQGRGVTFIEPATAVYEGMIVGVNSKENDITVNVCKGKKLTNMRSKSHDGVIQLTPPVKLTLEQALDFLGDDELLEITPLSLRLRKKHLTELDRKRADRKVLNSKS
jgi:GTP-binding protein